jgi:hypothetical protein
MVAILAGPAASPRDAPGWAHGTDAIGMAEIGAAATGTTGMGIGIITVTIVSSSSAISAFQGGGAGAGDIQDIMAMGIRTATTGTAMAIRTDTAVMDTVTTATVTAMDMATVLAANTVAANTALRLGREWPSYNGDSHAPAIIAGQSMESWGLRRGAQFELTNRSTVTLTQADPGVPADFHRGPFDSLSVG